VCVSVCVCISFCICVCIVLYVCVCVSFCMCDCVCIVLNVCVSVCVCVYIVFPPEGSIVTTPLRGSREGGNSQTTGNQDYSSVGRKLLERTDEF